MALAAAMSNGIIFRSLALSADRSGARRTLVYFAFRAAASDATLGETTRPSLVWERGEPHPTAPRSMSEQARNGFGLIVVMGLITSGCLSGWHVRQVLLNDDPAPALLLEHRGHGTRDHVRFVARVEMRHAVRSRYGSGRR